MHPPHNFTTFHCFCISHTFLYAIDFLYSGSFFFYFSKLPLDTTWYSLVCTLRNKFARICGHQMNMETRIFGRKYIAKWMLKWLKDRRGFITRFNKQYRSKSKHVSHVQQDFTRSLDPFRLCRSLCSILCSTLSITFTASECSGIERVRILMPMAHDERKSWRVCSLQLCLDAIWLQCSTIITWAYRGWRKSFRYDWFSATLPTSCFFRASFQICYDGRPWNAHGKHRLVDPAFLTIPQPRDQCHKGAPPATELQRRACLSSPPAKSGPKSSQLAGADRKSGQSISLWRDCSLACTETRRSQKLPTAWHASKPNETIGGG